MKKCKKCGALQSDERSVCLDCGAVLGKPLTDEEEAAAEAALDDTLDGMAERMEDFYVPLRDKIMGVVCILGVIAAFVLLGLIGAAKGDIKASIPDGVMVSVGNGFTTVATDGASDYSYPYARVEALNDAALIAVCSILAYLVACPMLLFPRIMWLIDTWKYRVFHNWDTTPSEFALWMRKAVTYFLFCIGVVCTVWSYIAYFS